MTSRLCCVAGVLAIALGCSAPAAKATQDAGAAISSGVDGPVPRPPVQFGWWVRGSAGTHFWFIGTITNIVVEPARDAGTSSRYATFRLSQVEELVSHQNRAWDDQWFSVEVDSAGGWNAGSSGGNCLVEGQRVAFMAPVEPKVAGCDATGACRTALELYTLVFDDYGGLTTNQAGGRERLFQDVTTLPTQEFHDVLRSILRHDIPNSCGAVCPEGMECFYETVCARVNWERPAPELDAGAGTSSSGYTSQRFPDAG